MGASTDLLDPDLRQGLLELTQLVSASGGLLTITSTVRSAQQQDFLWKRYRKGESPLPAAAPGHSAHEYGWAFDAIVSPGEWQSLVGRAWEHTWGGKWGGARDPVHFELPGASQLAYKLGEQGAQTLSGPVRKAPIEGDAFYKLADFFSSFIPGLGQVQLVDTLVSLLDHNNDIASWYLQHPAEAVRDLTDKILSYI